MAFNVKPYAKAFVAAAVAGASFAIPVVDDGLVASEVLGIAVATLTAFGAVFAVPNQTRAPEDFQARGYGSGVRVKGKPSDPEVDPLGYGNNV